MTTVTADAWSEVVPASHSSEHVYLTVEDGDVYLSSDEEPKQAAPYGVLVREGDQIGASTSDPGSILQRGQPIYARAESRQAKVRAVFDSRVEPAPRRVTESPGEAASRLERLAFEDGTASSLADGGQTQITIPIQPAAATPWLGADYPVAVESIFVSFLNQSVDPTGSTWTARLRDADENTRQVAGGVMNETLNFDPALTFNEDGAEVILDVSNNSGATATVKGYVNFRATRL